MLFNSYLFILVFLPLCVSGYFFLNHHGWYKAAQIFLVAMSLWFYGYFNLSYLTIILVSISANFIFGRLLLNSKILRWKKAIFIFALIANIASIFYYKYYDFFIDNVNLLFKTDFTLKNILLPLGISFFTFQQISYIIDSYNGEVPRYDFLHYISFVSFFPQLIAGPIVTHDELVPQFIDTAKKHVDWENLAKGIYIFVLGLAKKMLLADIFGISANLGYSHILGLDSTGAIVTMLSYTFQIYFDFSGYCDMAIGIGKMMNIDLPLNFNSPYKALSISEFWDRWHITLTRFFTKYIYIPLGGSRKGPFRTYLHIMIVFLVSGLWHGASWTFIFWGFLHGLFSVIYRRFKSFFDSLHPALNWIICFTFINFTWVFFRADSINHALVLLKSIFALNFGPIPYLQVAAFSAADFSIFSKLIAEPANYPNLSVLLYFLIAFFIVLGPKNLYEKMQRFKPSIFNMGFCAFLLIWCVISLSNVSTFLYFNF